MAAPDPRDAAATPPPLRGRLNVRMLRALIRNPLEVIPPAIYHEPMVRVALGGRERVYLADPELIHEALVRRADSLAKTPEMHRALGPALGEGLLTADGASWRWQRRAVASAFQPARVRELAPAMIAAAERTRDRWLAGDPAQPLGLGHEMMRTTFDIIVRTMLADPDTFDVARFERGVTEYLEPIGWALAFSLLKLPTWAPYPGRRGALRATAELRATARELVADRRARPTDRTDLLTLLQAAEDPESGRRLDDEAIVDNLLTFIAAGHETTALGLAWCLHLLSDAPEVERRLAGEIDTVTGGGPVLPEHLDRLVYVRQVFSEAMRLFPPAPLISRDVREPFELGGLPLERGAGLIIPIYALHRNTRLWDDPERFDPDRFAPEAAAARHRFAYMPFGAGPRVCIGSGFALQEGVAVLAVLLQRLRVRDASPAAPTPVMRITLRPKPDLLMTAVPR